MKSKITTFILFSFILISLVSSGCVTGENGNQTNTTSKNGIKLTDSQNNQLFQKVCPECGSTLKIVGSMSYETKNGMILVKDGNFECPKCGAKYSCSNFTCYKN